MNRGDTPTMAMDLYSADSREGAVRKRLYSEFEATVPLSVMRSTLARAEHDLTGQIVPEAWDEMVYRLARYRLEQITSDGVQR